MPDYKKAPSPDFKSPHAIVRRIADTLSAYRKHTDNVYKTKTLSKYQRMKDELRRGNVKRAEKIGEQVDRELTTQGEREMRNVAKQMPADAARKGYDTGPRGGTFYVTASGARVYVGKK